MAARGQRAPRDAGRGHGRRRAPSWTAASGAVTTNRLTVETGPAQEIQPLWVRFRAAISPSDTAGNNQILLDHVRVSALEGFSGTLITVE